MLLFYLKKTATLFLSRRRLRRRSGGHGGDRVLLGPGEPSAPGARVGPGARIPLPGPSAGGGEGGQEGGRGSRHGGRRRRGGRGADRSEVRQTLFFVKKMNIWENYWSFVVLCCSVATASGTVF